MTCPYIDFYVLVIFFTTSPVILLQPFPPLFSVVYFLIPLLYMSVRPFELLLYQVN